MYLLIRDVIKKSAAIKWILLQLNLQTPRTWEVSKPLNEWEKVKLDAGGNVEELDLTGLSARMDISELGIILGPNLKVLILNEQGGIVGDIAIFGVQCPNLERLHGLRTGLSGDITAFKKCKNFTHLDCQSTGMSGSIAVFKYCPAAVYCRYWGSRVSRPSGCPSGRSLGCPYDDQYTSKDQMDRLRAWLEKN